VVKILHSTLLSGEKRLICKQDNRGGEFMVLNATFNNISVISWRSVLLVEETGVAGENHRPVASHEGSIFTVKVIIISREAVTQLKQNNSAIFTPVC
jgi:hypothetical protein